MLEVAEQGRDMPGVFLEVAMVAQGSVGLHRQRMLGQAPTGSCSPWTAQGAQALLITALTPGELANVPSSGCRTVTQSCSHGLFPWAWSPLSSPSEWRTLRLPSLPWLPNIVLSFPALAQLTRSIKIG